MGKYVVKQVTKYTISSKNNKTMTDHYIKTTTEEEQQTKKKINHRTKYQSFQQKEKFT